MKRKYLKWIGTATVVCIVGIALMGGAQNPETNTVKNLLEKRNSIMENVLFGKITYEEGKKQLREIEKDQLYNDDLRALLKYKNTDLETIEKMEILKLKKKSRIYDMMTFYGKIKWIYSGNNKIYENTDEYQIGVEVRNNEYKLVSLEMQK